MIRVVVGTAMIMIGFLGWPPQVATSLSFHHQHPRSLFCLCSIVRPMSVKSPRPLRPGCRGPGGAHLPDPDGGARRDHGPGLDPRVHQVQRRPGPGAGRIWRVSVPRVQPPPLVSSMTSRIYTIYAPPLIFDFSLIFMGKKCCAWGLRNLQRGFTLDCGCEGRRKEGWVKPCGGLGAWPGTS